MENLLRDGPLLYIAGALTGAAVLLLLSLYLWRGSARRRPSADKVWPFFAKRPLSDTEKDLYKHLVKALPGHIVLAQVRLSQLLGVRKGHSLQEWYGRIAALSADFVVCAQDGAVLAVIGLDNSEGGRNSRRDSDAITAKALAAANIRFLRWAAWNLPDEAEIRSQLLAPETATAIDPLDRPLRATD